MAAARSGIRIDGIIGTKISPPCMRSKLLYDEVHALLQRYPEPRHARVGDRQVIAAFRQQLVEQRHDRAAGADHIAVAHDAKGRAMPPAMLFAATNSLSEASLVAPYRLIGLRGLVG